MTTELDLDDVAAQSKKATAELAELRSSEKTWIDTASFFSCGEDFYRGLVDECAKHVGGEVFVADDGSVSEDPIRLKVPELVAKQAGELAELRAELERLRANCAEILDRQMTNDALTDRLRSAASDE